MIIWTGLGFLVAVIGFGALILTEFVSEKITGNNQFYQENGWVMLVGFLFAAALTFGLHLLLRLKKGRVLIDQQTGAEVVLDRNHTLFFISVKWWPVAYVFIGIVVAIVKNAK